MNHIRPGRRPLRILTAITATLVTLGAAAPAAFAQPWPHPGSHRVPTPAQIHTVVTGGMPGWQIALIAVGAAFLAATAVVLLERARLARRHLSMPTT